MYTYRMGWVVARVQRYQEHQFWEHGMQGHQFCWEHGMQGHQCREHQSKEHVLEVVGYDGHVLEVVGYDGHVLAVVDWLQVVAHNRYIHASVRVPPHNNNHVSEICGNKQKHNQLLYTASVNIFTWCYRIPIQYKSICYKHHFEKHEHCFAMCVLSDKKKQEKKM